MDIDKVISKIRQVRTLNEEAPANAVGGGHIAGVGVGPQGEPGVDMRRKNQRNRICLSELKGTYREFTTTKTHGNWLEK